MTPVAENYPVRDNRPMRWVFDRDVLIRRANDRAYELEGVSAGTLFKKMGLPEDLLAKRKGEVEPKFKTLTRAADALQWTVPQLLGFEPERDLDERRLDAAVRLVDQTFHLNAVTAEECAAMLSAIYKWLSVFERDHPDLGLDDSALGAFGTMLREQFGKRDRLIS